MYIYPFIKNGLKEKKRKTTFAVILCNNGVSNLSFSAVLLVCLKSGRVLS
jgi:hypothetical protein